MVGPLVVVEVVEVVEVAVVAVVDVVVEVVVDAAVEVVVEAVDDVVVDVELIGAEVVVESPVVAVTPVVVVAALVVVASVVVGAEVVLVCMVVVVVTTLVVVARGAVVGGAVTTITGGTCATVGVVAPAVGPGAAVVEVTPAAAGTRACAGCSFHRRFVPQISCRFAAPSTTSFSHSGGHFVPVRNEVSATRASASALDSPREVRMLTSYLPAGTAGTMRLNCVVFFSAVMPFVTP